MNRLRMLAYRPIAKGAQWFCGKTAHNFIAVMVASDERGTFVVDPLVKCTYCGKAMNEEYYAMVVEALTAEMSCDEESW